MELDLEMRRQMLERLPRREDILRTNGFGDGGRDEDVRRSSGKVMPVLAEKDHCANARSSSCCSSDTVGLETGSTGFGIDGKFSTRDFWMLMCSFKA